MEKSKQKTFFLLFCEDSTDIHLQNQWTASFIFLSRRVFRYDATRGFACVNAEQPGGARCHDYKVRFTCPLDFCSV